MYLASTLNYITLRCGMSRLIVAFDASRDMRSCHIGKLRMPACAVALPEGAGGSPTAGMADQIFLRELSFLAQFVAATMLRAALMKST